MNQSKLEENTSSRHEARENVCERVTIAVLVLLLIGWESGASFLNQSLSVVTQNQSKWELLSTLNWKPLKIVIFKYNKTHHVFGREAQASQERLIVALQIFPLLIDDNAKPPLQ